MLKKPLTVKEKVHTLPAGYTSGLWPPREKESKVTVPKVFTAVASAGGLTGSSLRRVCTSMRGVGTERISSEQLCYLVPVPVKNWSIGKLAVLPVAELDIWE